MIKFLYVPRVSWSAFLLWFLLFALFSLDGATPKFIAQALAAFFVLVAADYAIRTHVKALEAENEARIMEVREAELREAEDDPNVLQQLRTMSESLAEQAHEIDNLRIDLRIAVAEKEKAIEEREDIRSVLNFNRVQWRANQLELQDINEQLAALQAQIAKGGGQ